MTRMEQQVDRLPLVGDGGMANHHVVAHVGLRNSASQSVKAEIRPCFSDWEGVEALIPQQGHMVQVTKVLCKVTFLLLATNDS